jgi:hypothetical protein
MEGIDDETPSARTRLRMSSLEPEMREWRLVERWLVFFFAVSVIAISVVALGFAAFVVR